MRSTKLTAAVAAAAAALALAPAGAAAAVHLIKHKGHPNAAGCHVSISPEPRVVTSGDSVLVNGVLTCPSSAAVGGQTVAVYERIAGVPGAKIIGSPTTASDGSYTLTPAPLVTDTFFYAKVLKARSATREVKVAPTVEFEGPKTPTLETGFAHEVTFTGKVSPTDTGAEVVLQREVATSTEEWHTIQAGSKVKADGTFTIIHRFGIPGDANLRAVVRPHHLFDVRGASAPLSYVIVQAQNPNLTLTSASGDPINFGSPLKLTGTVKGGASEKVTLLARTFGSSTFAKVGEATTDGSGNYEFNIPSVAQNTYYKVTNGTIHSSVLFEGVKWVIDTATVSAAKVTSGQEVVFAGTVSPDRVGHFVYLEKRNQFGGGYHIVDLTTVVHVTETTGMFTIKYNPIGSGKQFYRIHIPGDPINMATSSSPFELEVTPAPVVLKPIIEPKLPH
jgi:hypothetical protein